MKNFKSVSRVFLMSAVLFAGGLTLSSCDKDEAMTPTPEVPAKQSMTYNYAFNTGQVGAGTAYAGMHANNITATLKIEELEANKSKLTVTLTNTMMGMEYMIHAHDAADPATTPNGTPYNESPNVDVLTTHIDGNGGTAMNTQEVNMSFAALTANYSGFFVVHDPTQAISTTDLTTYLFVGAFAR